MEDDSSIGSNSFEDEILYWGKFMEALVGKYRKVFPDLIEDVRAHREKIRTKKNYEND